MDFASNSYLKNFFNDPLAPDTVNWEALSSAQHFRRPDKWWSKAMTGTLQHHILQGTFGPNRTLATSSNAAVRITKSGHRSSAQSQSYVNNYDSSDSVPNVTYLRL